MPCPPTPALHPCASSTSSGLCRLHTPKEQVENTMKQQNQKQKQTVTLENVVADQ